MSVPRSDPHAVQHHDVVVVGGGIAGLAAAHALATGGRDVVLVEADDRVGGKLWQRDLAGRPTDVGADSLLARHGAGVELARSLGLELGHPSTGSVQLLVDGHLRRLPAGVVLGVPTDLPALARSRVLSPLGLARAGLEGVWPRRRRGAEDRSVAAVVGDRFGSQVVERLVEPLLGGIYAGRPDRLSVRATTPIIAEADEIGHSLAHGMQEVLAERRMGMPVFAAPVGGMASLADALAAAIRSAGGGASIRTGTQVTGLARVDESWHVEVGSERLGATVVVLAVPAHVGRRLLVPVASTTAAELAGIDHASVGVLALAFADATVSDLPEASGILVPRREGALVKAATWLARKWPHMADRGAVLRASVGRIDDHRWQDLDDHELVRAVTAEVRGLTGIDHDLGDAVVTRWHDGLPQYEVGHPSRVDRARAGLPEGLLLAGAAYDGIGVSPCVASGEQAAADAKSLLERL